MYFPCSSPETSSILLLNFKEDSTKRKDSSKVLTPTSWMSSVQVQRHTFTQHMRFWPVVYHSAFMETLTVDHEGALVSVQAATRSPRCSAMRRPWCCAWDVPPCCASQVEERPDWLRVTPPKRFITASWPLKKKVYTCQLEVEGCLTHVLSFTGCSFRKKQH